MDDHTPALVWFGHSSYLIKYQQKNILVDPVFSGHASPISTAVKSFKGSDVYSVEDMPEINVLLLTHDHYDHIDFKSVSLLKNKTKKVICPLGCGEHLEYWGFDPNLITELDWWQDKVVGTSLKITATPARHFSGRGLIRNKTLWASYVLELGTYRIFVGGDSGYDDQFKKIGERFKSFDLALVECGQYGKNWPYIHMFPEQTAQVARDLNAKVLMPVHWGKFILSLHPWTEPIERVLIKGAELGQDIITPLIGEVVRVGENRPNSKWWRDF
ncbi:MAG: MBL fold metallo-hydrolase [Pseudobdellovibrio sp.]